MIFPCAPRISLPDPFSPLLHFSISFTFQWHSPSSILFFFIFFFSLLLLFCLSYPFSFPLLLNGISIRLYCSILPSTALFHGILHQAFLSFFSQPALKAARIMYKMAPNCQVLNWCTCFQRPKVSPIRSWVPETPEISTSEIFSPSFPSIVILSAKNP